VARTRDRPRSRCLVVAALALAAAAGTAAGCAQSHAVAADCGFGLGGTALCDVDSLRAALASARPGDVVRVGDCRVTGPLDVPDGVTLVGSGETRSVIVAADDGALVVHGGATDPRVTCLGVAVATGVAGVRATGPGAVVLDDLDFEVERGVGIDVRDLDSLSISGVTLVGSITRDTVMSAPTSPTAMNSASVGVSISNVAAATVTSLDVTGFADIAAVVSESGSAWSAITIHESLGTELAVSGGTTTLDDVAVSDAFQGARLLPAYGVAIVSMATIRTSGLTVERSGGYGVLQDSATAEHDGLSVSDASEAGLWVQRSPAVTITGSTIAGSGGAGIALVGVDLATVTDSSVTGTRLRTRVCETRAGDVGDGLQIREAPGADIERVMLSDNERVGLVVQLPSDPAEGPRFTAVTVSGTGEQRGALAVDHRGVVVSPDGWDVGITRGGATVANDASALGSLMAPPCPM